MAGLRIKQTDINTIVFDFDGTLAKLNIDFQIMRETTSALISAHGVTNDQLRADYVLEMIDEAFTIISHRSPKQAQVFFDDAKSIIEKIETDAAHNGELFNYTKKLFSTLQSKNISLGIITRNCAKAIAIIFPDVSNYCPIVICRDDVRHVKPHPEQIILALKKLDSSPKNTLVIGDHPLDIKTGFNVGTKTCGVLTGRAQREDLISAGADLVLSKASDILKMIT